ncbi:Adenosine deaminase/editase [Niveomyces insectorum RCEF 264]|uniref:Adenosine deaminase/editase n=1 Tax=Niveomyces insectorum RCEF 264 TaxID=1081102 RepID=A0A167VB62_9HYPO|nr:Adenosine deaminase/editase [Niveomyces insectorum RCEF 264]
MTQADAIADAVLREFDKLPANRKPAVRTNGVREWVPLSGIVAEFGDGDFVCLALATGMKCLPASKMASARGVGLHDWHAEVLTLRAFNRFVLQECRDVLLRGQTSRFLRFVSADEGSWPAHESDPNGNQDGGGSFVWRGQPFAWRDDVLLHMYCSEAPCGDASMELTMAAQDDAAPWTVTAVESRANANNTDSPQPPPLLLAGRGYFSELGTVRRKPARGDAPPTQSKSCSDKMALRQCVALPSGLTSLLVGPPPPPLPFSPHRRNPLYLASVVLPASQYSETGCRRCFSADPDVGRMHPVAGRTWPGGYAFTPFAVQTTRVEFAYSRRALDDSGFRSSAVSSSSSPPPHASSNVSVVWTRHGVNECLVGGVLRGRRAFDPAGASAVSRRQLWLLAREVADGLVMSQEAGKDGGDDDDGSAAGGQTGNHRRQQLQLVRDVLHAETYDAVKRCALLAARERAKADVKRLALRGWTSNEGDGSWGLLPAHSIADKRKKKKKEEHSFLNK